MKFVKMKDGTLGKSYIFLDLEGLKINSSVDITPLLSFRTDTYSVLKASADQAKWDTVFGIPTHFLSLQTDEIKIMYASLLARMHYEILSHLNTENEIEGSKMLQLENNLSIMLEEFDRQTDLYPKLVKYTEEYIKLQSFAGVGERAQDSAEMTFYTNDVIRLTAVTILCKMLAPIFGVFIESCKKKMDNAYKEIHCLTILKNFIANRCQELIDKLQNFVARIAKPMLNRIKLTHVWNGYTFSVIISQIFASILTRRTIVVDLNKPDGNIMTYVTSCTRAAAHTQYSSTGFKTAVVEIVTPDDSATDDGNVSTMEAESRQSSKTADFELIIELAIAKLEQSFVTEHELDPNLIKAMRDYYTYNHIPVTPMNHFLMSLLFGPALCGAKSIELLDTKNFNYLIPLMQLFFMQQGYYELVHLVSLLPSSQYKSQPAGSEMLLRSTWNSSFEYKNCAEKFPYIVNDISWDTALKGIIDTVTSNSFKFNTAPVIWDMMNQSNHNTELYIASSDLSKMICSFIAQLYS